MAKTRASLTVLLLVLAAGFIHAAETPIPPAPNRWVTDTVGFMSVEAARSLDTRLEAYERDTGHQLLVYIGQTTGGVPVEDWAVRAFQAWKVGRQGMDDGLVLFIMAEDRKLRIEVGYGLESQVTDALASRIINETIVPRIQAGNRDEAVISGMDAVVRIVSGQGLPDATGAARAPEDSPLTLGHWILFGLIGIVFLFLLATNPSLAFYLLINILAGSRRGSSQGGTGWSGGGFRGGGGRSGGGGASGSW
jgi:uncharacterized protein